MAKAILRRERITIPTYPVGDKQPLPMFFEKRVYQGSSGRVYPNPVVEKIFDNKVDATYDAVILENDYLYVVVLPELGGRIYTAYDKTNNYDFVYHNRVIKPALVGLLGPWISGGIEFNWPQHHRPSTFDKVNCHTATNDDGSVSVFVGEVENMFGLEQVAEIKLYPNSAFIEINVQVFNRSDLDQTFLWWANPAYKVNDHTATVMPPDVSAVMDHGKRAVSTYPIATGEYYKMDYSSGVDISRYKNIPVPTSFMAHKSNFDFVGGYDFGKQAGLFHFADHHVSPGKKQWTWGNGDFGQAWDRNLTDEDGPYVELMTGCFTDNQPDFTFIRPGEEKTFTQYFAPYKQVGYIKNANKHFCIGLQNGTLTVYSTSLTPNACILATVGKTVLVDEVVDFAPTSVYVRAVPDNAKVEIVYDGGRLAFEQSMVEHFPVPAPAEAIPLPELVATCEELYLFGLHIEQYRHATHLPEHYYLEGLRRDPTDVRLNTAYGNLLLRRGLFGECKQYFENAIAKLTCKNPNPATTEPYFGLAVAQLHTGDYALAYDNFYKCTWSAENKSAAFYYLALLSYRKGDYPCSVAHAKQSVAYNAHNAKAQNLLGRALWITGNAQQAQLAFEEVLRVNPLDHTAKWELSLLEGNGAVCGATDYEITDVAKDYLLMGERQLATDLLNAHLADVGAAGPLVYYYLAYAACGTDLCRQNVLLAERNKHVVYFPNRLMDVVVLQALEKEHPNYFVSYCLGNAFYDKKQYDLAAGYWADSVAQKADFAPARRNLALYYYNKQGDGNKAQEQLCKAYELEKHNSRIMMELFHLYLRCDKSRTFLLEFLTDNLAVANERDDLWLEYLSLLADVDAQQAENLILSRKFHPWEGGEGKVTKLYKRIKIALAKQMAKANDFDGAIAKLQQALTYPHNLGEGKLALDTDNDVHYALGKTYRAMGNQNLAVLHFELATMGNGAIGDDMYYNDSPVEYVYYMAKAHKALGNCDQAEQIKQSMLRYAQQNQNVAKQIDYFAVSLPDLMIWEEDPTLRNQRFCAKLQDIANKL